MVSGLGGVPHVRHLGVRAGGNDVTVLIPTYLFPFWFFLFHRVLLRIIYSSTLLATYSLCGGQGEIDMHSFSVLMLK